MLLESAQMLSTAHRLLDGKETEFTQLKPKFKKIKGIKTEIGWIKKTVHKFVLDNPEHEQLVYKVAHKNHPSSIWVRQSPVNYQWLFMHFAALCDEYTFRYGKIHMTETKLLGILAVLPARLMRDLNEFESQPPPCCMPDECKITNDTVINYRNYYVTEKKQMLKYTKREMPDWVAEAL